MSNKNPVISYQKMVLSNFISDLKNIKKEIPAYPDMRNHNDKGIQDRISQIQSLCNDIINYYNGGILND